MPATIIRKTARPVNRIIFDSTRTIPAPATFAAGVYPTPRSRPVTRRAATPLVQWDAEAGCYRLDLFAADLDAYQTMIQADADRAADEALDRHYEDLAAEHLSDAAAREATLDEAWAMFGCRG